VEAPVFECRLPGTFCPASPFPDAFGPPLFFFQAFEDGRPLIVWGRTAQTRNTNFAFELAEKRIGDRSECEFPENCGLPTKYTEGKGGRRISRGDFFRFAQTARAELDFESGGARPILIFWIVGRRQSPSRSGLDRRTLFWKSNRHARQGSLVSWIREEDSDLILGPGAVAASVFDIACAFERPLFQPGF